PPLPHGQGPRPGRGPGRAGTMARRQGRARAARPGRARAADRLFAARRSAFRKGNVAGPRRLTVRHPRLSAQAPEQGLAMPARKGGAEKAPDAGPGGVMAIRLVLQILELLGKRESVGVTELANA